MRKTALFMLIAALIFMMFAGCEKDEFQGTVPTPEPQTATSGPTADELRALIGQYEIDGDYESVYEAALELIKLEPADAEVYTTAAAALLEINNKNDDEIDRLLKLCIKNTGEDSGLLSELAQENHGEHTNDETVISDDTSPEEIISFSDEDIVAFTDDVLEAKLREAIGKPEGDITYADVKTVKVLAIGRQDGEAGDMIADIGALKYFTNLTELNLDNLLYNSGGPVDIGALSNLVGLKKLSLKNCNIVDIGPIGNLTALEYLEVQLNGISDISPLAGLVNLVTLSLPNNPFSDVGPLGGLTSLTTVYFYNNPISDISALSGLTGLETLGLQHLQITDVSPLAGLSNLKGLFLEGNPIEDYSPLADIYPNLQDKDFDIN